MNHNPMAKSKANPASLRLAVNAHCYMCMGGEEDDLRTQGSVVSLIKGCRSSICPLIFVRPFNPSLQQSNNDAQGEVQTCVKENAQ